MIRASSQTTLSLVSLLCMLVCTSGRSWARNANGNRPPRSGLAPVAQTHPASASVSETGGTPHDHRSYSLNKASAQCCRPALRARSPEYSLTRGAMADSVECRVSCRGVGRGARQLVRGGLVVGGCVLVSGGRASCALLAGCSGATAGPSGRRWCDGVGPGWRCGGRAQGARRGLRAAACS